MNGIICDSPETLNSNISIAMDGILSEIMHELHEELQDRIEQNVYEAYKGWYYEMGYRTNEFLESFVLSHANVLYGISPNIKEIEREIYQDPTIMTVYYGFPYSHEDRDRLTEIIESGEGYNVETDIPPRPFWDEWIEWCMLQIPMRFKQKCHQRGLNIT
jgi:hypothetical protein